MRSIAGENETFIVPGRYRRAIQKWPALDLFGFAKMTVLADEILTDRKHSPDDCEYSRIEAGKPREDLRLVNGSMPVYMLRGREHTAN